MALQVLLCESRSILSTKKLLLCEDIANILVMLILLLFLNELMQRLESLC